MTGMAQLLRQGRLAWAWCTAVYAVLVAGTAVAAVTLLSRSIDQGLEVWPDAQMDTQMVAAWRGAATLAYTSGSEVGHVCALLAGLLVARVVATRAWRTGLVVAVLAGAVLALVNLSSAWWKASPRLTHTIYPVDPGLRHHVGVIVAIALVFAAFLVLAAAGYILGLKHKVKTLIVTLMVLVVAAPYSHFIWCCSYYPGRSSSTGRLSTWIDDLTFADRDLRMPQRSSTFSAYRSLTGAQIHRETVSLLDGTSQLVLFARREALIVVCRR